MGIVRERLKEALKTSLKEQDAIAVSTLRLILAALKDRDIAARTKGEEGVITDDRIYALLQTMIKQRRESIEHYEKGGRLDLAEREQRESEIIQSFLPKQLEPEEVDQAVTTTIAEFGASGLRDMGKVMGALKERYVGQMDFGKASAVVKEKLAAG